MMSDFFTGGFLVLAGGVIAGKAWSVPAAAFNWAKNRLLFTIEIDNSDSAFIWLKQWLAAHSKSRYLTAASVWPEESEGGRRRPKFFLCPRGMCTVRWRGKRMLGWVHKTEVQGNFQPRETIVLQCLRGSQAAMIDLLNEAHDFGKGIDGDVIEIWLPDGTGWQLADRKPFRRLDTLDLGDGVIAQVFDDAKNFLKLREWYRDRGVPWRRGYLLEGPPGNGKSSIAHALASELKTNINVLNVAAIESDAQLFGCMLRVPRGNIVLLEDIDAAWVGRTESDKTKVSFSGILNALDGATARDGRIVIMTTNHVDKLDPALIRPGRADVHVHIGDATAAQGASMFHRFFADEPIARAHLFGDVVVGQSMATIQTLLLKCSDDPDELMDTLMPVADDVAA